MFTKIPPNYKSNKSNKNDNNICDKLFDECKKTEFNSNEFNCYYLYIKCNKNKIEKK